MSDAHRAEVIGRMARSGFTWRGERNVWAVDIADRTARGEQVPAEVLHAYRVVARLADIRTAQMFAGYQVRAA